MAIEVYCDNCFTTMKVRNDMLGRRIRCRECRAPVVVESDDDDFPDDDDFESPLSRGRGSSSRSRRRGGSRGFAGSLSPGMLIGAGAGGALLLVVLTITAVRMLTGGDADQLAGDIAQGETVEGHRPPEQPRRIRFPASGSSTTNDSSEEDSRSPNAARGPSRPSRTASGSSRPSAVAPPVVWNVQADSTGENFAPSPRRINVPYPEGIGQDYTVYPEHTSRFVALGSNFRPSYVREVWDLSTRKQIGSIRAELGVQRGVLGPDGRYFACQAGTEGKLLLFDVKSGQAVAEIPLAETRLPVTPQVRFAGAERLAVLRYQQPLEVWTIPDARKQRTIPIETNPEIKSLATSPGGRYAALVVRSSDSRTSELRIFDLEQGKTAGTIPLEPLTGRNAVNCDGLAYSRDGRYLAGVLRSFAKDFGHRLIGWDMLTGKLAFEHELNKDLKRNAVRGTNHSPDVRWFPGIQRMLVYGRFVFDRQAGGPIWRVPEDVEADGETATVFGDDRVLVVGGKSTDRHVMQVKLPVEELAKATTAVSAGGLPIDVDLPPLTAASTEGMVMFKPAEQSIAGQWRVVPDSPLKLPDEFLQSTIRIDAQPATIGSVLISSSNPPRAAIALDATDRNSSVQILELTEDAESTTFNIPFKAKVLAISPDGTRLLTRVKDSDGRLDVWSVPDGRHVVGWRPHQEVSESIGGIKAARFVDSAHVLTRARNKTIALWELPSCRCVFTFEGIDQSDTKLSYEQQMAAIQAKRDEDAAKSRRSSGKAANDQPLLNPGLPAISPGGKTLAIWHLNVIYFVQAHTGQILGQLPVEGTLGAAAFSPSGQKFAATFLCSGGARLLAINLADGSTLAEVPLDSRGSRLHWCRDNTLLLDNSRLIDLNHGRIVWTYTHNSILHSPDSPDGRHYALVGRVPRLMASTLPHASLATRLQGDIPPPQLLVGKGKRVTLDMQVSGTPADLAGFAGELQQQFEEQLATRGMQTAPEQPLRLTVTVTPEDTGRTTQYKPFGRSAGQPAVSVNERLIHCEISLKFAGSEIWKRNHKSSNLTSSVALLKRGESLQENLNRGQWDIVRKYLSGVTLPSHLYPAEGARSLGTSVLKAGS